MKINIKVILTFLITRSSLVRPSIIMLLVFNSSFLIINAQVGINDNNASPDASAMLDVKSTTKGMLIPRMTTTERDNISSAATGLMIYNTTTNKFNYYNGTAWTVVGDDNLGDHTATSNIQVGSHFISNDGTNKGLSLDQKGQMTITANHSSYRPAFFTTTHNDLTYVEVNNLAGTRALWGTDGAWTGSPHTDVILANWSNGGMNFYTNATKRANISNTGLFTITGSLKVVDGTQGVGKVLASDANGQASWSTLSALGVNELADADNDTKIQVEKSADEDSIRFDILGTERLVMKRNSGDFTLLSFPNNRKNLFLGQDAGLNTASATTIQAANNTFVGYQAGYSNTTGTSNLFYGASAGYSNTTGDVNIYIGEKAGYSSTTASFNTYIGQNAGYSTTTGFANLFIGNSTGADNTTGQQNIYLGASAFQQNSTGSNNTIIGVFAGLNNITGSGNVFIGHSVGFNETGSNKLYIDNSNTSTPLIHGDFSTNALTINGTLATTGSIKMADGSQGVGKVLVSDANGQATWTTLSIPEGTPDTAQPVPIEYHGYYIYVHPTDNGTTTDWATAKTTCDNLTAFGKSDWYLPTRLELDAMYKQSYRITGLSQTEIVKYWSSTAKDATFAYTQRLDYGGPDPDDKTDTNGHNCRCVRKD